MSEIRLTPGAAEIAANVAECITVETPIVSKSVAESVNQTLRFSSELFDKMRESQAFLDAAKDYNKAYIAELRNLRMSVAAEVNTMRKDLEDLRKFFLCRDHTEEIARLKEFLELCERLKALKESGFLDSVADTLLKLA